MQLERLTHGMLHAGRLAPSRLLLEPLVALGNLVVGECHGFGSGGVAERREPASAPSPTDGRFPPMGAPRVAKRLLFPAAMSLVHVGAAAPEPVGCASSLEEIMVSKVQGAPQPDRH